MAILDSRSGKDTFVNLCQKHLLWCGNFSTVDFVKEVAAMCGWDGTKSAENRKFLSDLKDLLTEWNDVPYKKIERAIDLYEEKALSYDFSSDDVLCFIHCREPKEIQKFVDKMNATTLLIRRPSVENINQSNHAGEQVLDYCYDYIITNDSTIEELEEKVIGFLKEMKFKNLK